MGTVKDYLEGLEKEEEESKYHFAREMLFNLRASHAISNKVYLHWIDKLIEDEKKGKEEIANICPKCLRHWCIEISQNGWEYTGTATIKSKECIKVDDRTVLADGIEIEFDEEINEPYVC